jgi:hypothetical protein
MQSTNQRGVPFLEMCRRVRKSNQRAVFAEQLEKLSSLLALSVSDVSYFFAPAVGKVARPCPRR